MSEEAASNANTEKDWEGYYSYRSQLEQLRVQQITAFDSAIVNLTSGALGLSVVILTALGALTTPIHLDLLFGSWVLFVVTIVANLISYQTGARSMSAEMEAQDAVMRDEDLHPGKRWKKATLWLNRLVIVTFPVGAILLLAFAALNATAVKANEQPKPTASVEPAPLNAADPKTADQKAAPAGAVPTGVTPSTPPARPKPTIDPVPAPAPGAAAQPK